MPSLGGPWRRILEAAGPFSVSSRGDIAFHRPGTGTSPGPIFILPAGSASIEPWHPECVSSGAPVWSPDGSRIAFAGLCRPPSDGAQQRDGEILVGPRAGGTITRIGTVQTRTPAPRLARVRLSSGADALLIPQRSGDSVNLHRLMLDGGMRAVTSGTGLENWPAVSPSGDLLSTRTEQTPSIWSLALSGGTAPPTKEVSPGRMFGTSLDGSQLVFGRMLGADQGQLVLRDRGRSTESVLATHTVVREGIGLVLAAGR